MKIQTIRKRLKAKFNELVESIDSNDIAETVAENAFITGGCITSMLLDEEINDYDVYFRNNVAAEKVANYYVDRFIDLHRGRRDSLSKALRKAEYRKDGEGVSVMVDYDVGYISEKGMKFCGDAGEFRPIAFTSNAITLSNSNGPDTKPDIVQMITRFTGSPVHVHSNFDFVHCFNTYNPRTGDLYLDHDAVLSIMTKELRYVGSKYPICSILRTRKYITRGWTINAGQYLKMCMQVNALDLHNIDVLREQLVGVDSMYFMRFISAIEKHDVADLDHCTLFKIIDDIFDDEDSHDAAE